MRVAVLITFIMIENNSRIYLDYAAATPMDGEVKKAMEPFYGEKFGSAGALHSFGQEASAAIDSAREITARELSTEFNEIIFTGSATEANNHIIRGAVKSFLKPKTSNLKPKIIISAIEHESVYETAKDLEKRGVEVVTIPVSTDGILDMEKLNEALDESVAVISIIFASNVIGVVQSTGEIAEIIREFREKSGSAYPLFHTDAVQAFQFMKLDMKKLGADALTLSGHKIYGAKGAGILALKKEWQGRLTPLITGGGQEYGLRGGTENVPAIVGFGRAVELVARGREEEARRIGGLRNQLWEGIKKIAPDAIINGGMENRLPNNLHVSFPGQDNQELLIKFDQAGIAVSIGSACSMRARKVSRVVLELGVGVGRAKNSIRFTLGRQTTREEIEEALKRAVKVI